MRRIIAVSAVEGQLKRLAHWVSRRQGRAVIRLAGRPAAVLISYREYEEMDKLRTQAHKSELLDKLQRLRARSA